MRSAWPDILVSLRRSLKAALWRGNQCYLYTPVTTLCPHQLSTVQKHTPVEVSPQVVGFLKQGSVSRSGVELNLILVIALCPVSVSSTMMDNFQSCRAAAWGFARHPAGTVWPTGTYRRPLFQTRVSPDLWGCVCCSLPPSRSASLSPTGHNDLLMQQDLQFYHSVWRR